MKKREKVPSFRPNIMVGREMQLTANSRDIEEATWRLEASLKRGQGTSERSRRPERPVCAEAGGGGRGESREEPPVGSEGQRAPQP